VYAALEKVPIPIAVSEIAVDVIFYPHGDAINKRYHNTSIKDGRYELGNILTDYIFHCSTQVSHHIRLVRHCCPSPSFPASLTVYGIAIYNSSS
jgi:hypothetical protein